MPRDPQTLVFVGIKDTVVALDDRTGSEVWRTELRSGDFTTVCWDGEALLAANSGEVYRLDPRSGAIVWHNQLKGLGRGVVSLTTTRLTQPASSTDAAIAKRKRDEQAAAAAAAG